MRYELYHKIKACWEEKLAQGTSYDSEAEEQAYGDEVITEEKILEMAQQMDIDGIYESVFALYGVEFDYEIALQVKKMEYIFLK